jgi:DNA-binding NarL/FixJ family response regulator
LFTLGRMDEAAEVYLHAHQAAILQETRPLLWRIHQRLGRLYKQRGERRAATTHFNAARDVIDALAATISELQVREQFLSYALSHLPTPPTLTPLRGQKQSVDGLTAREMEIALLIQQGNTDREIAERLTLSRRTVSTHVSNILTKLDFSTRAQIAAWVVTKGV